MTVKSPELKYSVHRLFVVAVLVYSDDDAELVLKDCTTRTFFFLFFFFFCMNFVPWLISF